MARRTKHQPERGEARVRILEAARDIIREKGFAATTVDDLCARAAVTKGAFFHHFASKEALGVAAAAFWAETTGAFFAAAPYHKHADPLERVLAYVAFRRSIIEGELYAFTCLVGTLAEEVHSTWPAIRHAAAASIFGHAATLEADIETARRDRAIADESWSAAGNDPALAREALDHLARYIRLLFNEPNRKES